MSEQHGVKKTLTLYALSALFGVVGGLITIGMIVLLDVIVTAVWQNGVGISSEAPTRTIAIPIIIVSVSIVLAFINQWFKKPVGGMQEIMEQVIETGTMDWRRMPKALVTSLLSIGSGASLGPEAPASYLSAGVASATAELTKQPKETSQVMSLAAISGMLGSLLNAPFLAPAMIAEGGAKFLKNLQAKLTYSLVASAFGVGIFYVLYHTLFAVDVGLPNYSGATVEALLQAFLLGLFGAFMGLVVFIITNKVVHPFFKVFKFKPWQKTIFAGVVVGGLAFWLPITMFSGQHTVPHLISEAATLSFGMLIIIGIVKLISTGILLESGFFGGPIFPAIFAGTAFGLALAGATGVPVALAVPATMAGLLTLAIRQPFSAALLVVAITGAYTAAPVAVAVAGAMFLLIIMKQVQGKQAVV